MDNKICKIICNLTKEGFKVFIQEYDIVNIGNEIITIKTEWKTERVKKENLNIIKLREEYKIAYETFCYLTDKITNIELLKKKCLERADENLKYITECIESSKNNKCIVKIKSSDFCEQNIKTIESRDDIEIAIEKYTERVFSSLVCFDPRDMECSDRADKDNENLKHIEEYMKTSKK